MFCTSLMLLGLRIFHPIPTEGRMVHRCCHHLICQFQTLHQENAVRKILQEWQEWDPPILSSTTPEVNCSFYLIFGYRLRWLWHFKGGGSKLPCMRKGTTSISTTAPAECFASPEPLPILTGHAHHKGPEIADPERSVPWCRCSELAIKIRGPRLLQQNPVPNYGMRLLPGGWTLENHWNTEGKKQFHTHACMTYCYGAIYQLTCMWACHVDIKLNQK